MSVRAGGMVPIAVRAMNNCVCVAKSHNLREIRAAPQTIVINL